MRNRRRPDPFADLSESAIAQCRDAARADFSVAARAVAAAADRVQRAESVDDRLASAFELYRCSVTAAAVTVRYLRLGAHGAEVAGEVVPACVVRRAACLADRAAAREDRPMRLVRHVHAASSVDLLSAVPRLDQRGDVAPRARRSVESSAYDAVRPRRLDDVLDIAIGARDDAFPDETGGVR